jgi:membrane protein
LNRNRLIILGWRTWREFGRDNCSQMAAALSYYILFAIVPLTMFIVSVLATFIGSDNVQQQIADFISENFELSAIDVTLELTSEGREAIADEFGDDAVVAVEDELARLNAEEAEQGERAEVAAGIASDETVTIAGYPIDSGQIDVHYDNIILETISGVVTNSTPVTFVSFFVLGFAAIGLFGSVRRSLNFVWGMPKPPPFLTGKLWDVAFLLMLLALVIIIFISLLALSIAASVALRVLDPSDSGGQLVARLWDLVELFIPLTISFVTFLMLYKFGPKKHNRFGDVWPGALLAAIGFEALKFGYAIYATNFATFDVVYGALGGVLLFMLFTYLGAYIFLMGAELAAEYPAVIRGVHDGEPIPPIETALSIRDKLPQPVRGLLGGKMDPRKPS